MRASVVIRVLNGMRHGIDELIPTLLREQPGAEIVVVDSGSTDGTWEQVSRFPVTGLQIARERFSFGRALNLGTQVAGGDVVVALSADACPPAGWVQELAARFEDPQVACAFGETRWPDGSLMGAFRQDAAHARAHPFWGYSNGAGAFRRALWEERPFREDLPGCEDKEWALWALETKGMVCLLDPALAVGHDHTHDSLRESFAREAREARGYAMYLDLEPYGARDALREWWSDRGWSRSHARARLDPRRAARLAGRWWGRR